MNGCATGLRWQRWRRGRRPGDGTFTLARRWTATSPRSRAGRLPPQTMLTLRRRAGVGRETWTRPLPLTRAILRSVQGTYGCERLRCGPRPMRLTTTLRKQRESLVKRERKLPSNPDESGPPLVGSGQPDSLPPQVVTSLSQHHFRHLGHHLGCRFFGRGGGQNHFGHGLSPPPPASLDSTRLREGNIRSVADGAERSRLPLNRIGQKVPITPAIRIGGSP